VRRAPVILSALVLQWREGSGHSREQILRGADRRAPVILSALVLHWREGSGHSREQILRGADRRRTPLRMTGGADRRWTPLRTTAGRRPTGTRHPERPRLAMGAKDLVTAANRSFGATTDVGAPQDDGGRRPTLAPLRMTGG